MAGPSSVSLHHIAQAPLKTRRFLLRAPSAADIPAICRLINDPLIARFTAYIPHPYTPIEAWRFIQASNRMNPDSFSANFLISLRVNARHILGGAGFSTGWSGRVELGYWVAAGHRGRGIATEATRAMLYRIFTASDAEVVGASCVRENVASQRVLARSGFSRVGRSLRWSRYLRRRRPMIEFAITRGAWAALQRGL